MTWREQGESPVRSNNRVDPCCCTAVDFGMAITSNPRRTTRTPTIGDWLRPHLQWVTLPSWLLSLVVHAATIALCVFISQTPSCRSDIQGDGGESFREVGIYVPAAEAQDAPSEPAQTVPELAAAESIESPVPVLDEPPAPLALPEISSRPVLGAGGVPSIGGPPILSPAPAQTSAARASGARRIPEPGGGGRETSLFGASDRGSKFVYVIDRSWSMEGEGIGVTPMSMAKTELIASISRLDETQQFQIVMYNEAPTVLVADNGRFDYFFGTDVQRLDAVRQMSLVQPTGGTSHFPALKRALELAPDVVFFLTDGQEPALSAKELNQLSRLGRGARIHCIEFGKGPPIAGFGVGLPGNWLKKLASANEGTYVYHDVSRPAQP